MLPNSSDHFAVFTPYFGHWSRQRLRDALAAPPTVRVPDGIGSERLPSRERLSGLSPGLAAGGETEGRSRLSAWLGSGIEAYEDRHDDLAGDATSRLSPHLHFGTLSPVELVHRARAAGGPGAEAFVRQLAWRDFNRQVLAVRPEVTTVDYRARDDRWRSAPDETEAWRKGCTGYPVIDAAMRRLRHEGWMHNRGRPLTASFLTKTLYVDWRVGARHFLDLLVDGDVANNQLNWQWTAGTGTDTRPNRVLNPVTQAKRYDPDGEYVRRRVRELADVAGPAVHEPWKLRGLDRGALDHPEPIVELEEGRERFLRARRSWTGRPVRPWRPDNASTASPSETGRTISEAGRPCQPGPPSSTSGCRRAPFHAPAHRGDMASQGQASRGAGLGPQDHGRRADPVDRAGECLGGDGRTEHPGGQAEFAEGGGELLQRQAVLFARHAGQDDRARGGGVVAGCGRPVVAAQGRGDMPGQQMLDLDVTVAGRRPLAAHRVQRRHHHLLPGDHEPVLLDGPGQQVLHRRSVEAYGGAGKAPALLADVSRRRRGGRG